MSWMLPQNGHHSDYLDFEVLTSPLSTGEDSPTGSSFLFHEDTYDIFNTPVSKHQKLPYLKDELKYISGMGFFLDDKIQASLNPSLIMESQIPMEQETKQHFAFKSPVLDFESIELISPVSDDLFELYDSDKDEKYLQPLLMLDNPPDDDENTVEDSEIQRLDICNLNEAEGRSVLDSEPSDIEGKATRTGLRLRSTLSKKVKDFLPAPFSQQFYNLKSWRYLPLKVLQEDTQFQLNGEGLHSNSSMCNVDPTSALRPVPSGSDKKKNRYSSRLNIYELSRVLCLDMYHVKLTILVEFNVLEMFRYYCNFDLGYQTWRRGTSAKYRAESIKRLLSYTSVFYPELDSKMLETIIKRGSYIILQARLRNEKRRQRRT